MGIRSCSRPVIFAYLLTRLSGTLQAGEQRAVFFEPRYSFGSVMQGTPIEHDFVLKNTGDGPLRIVGMRTTSSLTIARMPAQVAPGAQVTLRVQLNTSGVSGDYKGTIQVLLNDPALPEAALLIDGRVVPPIELSPHPVFFLAARRGEQKQTAIEIRNHEKDPLRIVSVEHTSKRFSTELSVIEAGRRYRLSLILNADGPGGRKTEPIFVRTSSPTVPLITIPANTYLRERVYAFPDEVDLGVMRLADLEAHPEILRLAAQTLMVYQAGGSDFQVAAQSDLPFLDIRCEQGPKGDRYQITITLKAGRLRPGPIKGAVMVKTNDVEFPSFKVPVRGEIR